MRKRIVPIILIVALAVAGYFVWRYTQKTAAANAGLGGSGTVETEQIAITPQTSGRIIEAPPEEGIPVKKGDVLYRLDPASLLLQVKSAQAGVNAAEANYSHVKKDSGSSWADKQTAKAQLDQANVALNMARLQAGYADIHSPLDGTIASIAAHVGENASPGNTLVMVSNPASLTVTIYIAETDIGRVKIGQKGTVATDSTSGKTYSATVVFIGSQAEFTPSSIETKDQRTKLVFPVKLRVTDPDRALKPGMPADVVLAQ
jgi:HlyD family secretion protein